MKFEADSRFYQKIRGPGRKPWFEGYEISQEKIDPLLDDIVAHPYKYFGKKKGKPIPKKFLNALRLPPNEQTKDQAQRWDDVASFFEIPKDQVGIMIKATLREKDFIIWLDEHYYLKDLTFRRSYAITQLAKIFQVDREQMNRYLNKHGL